jgi:hypothetical protein
MNERNELWDRLEAVLDERRDPFAEPGLAAALAADPELGPAAERLTARLALLPESSPTVPAPRRLALAAAALVAGLGFLGLRGLVPDDPAPTPALASRTSTVWNASLVVEQRTPSPPRGERVVLEPLSVHAWTLTPERP